MFLKSLTLENFMQHKNLHCVFDGNLIGILGPNGVGKSNLFHAIQFAFTGEVPGVKAKAELITWGQTSGSVYVEFWHGEVACSIKRSLHNASVIFKHGDESYSGATIIAEKLKLLCGIDKDLIKQAAFVRQAEIDAVLFADPRIRELGLQQLCGISEASKIHRKLTEFLSDKHIEDTTKQLSDAKSTYAIYEAKLGTLIKTLEALKAKLDTTVSYKLLTEAIGHLDRKIQLIKEHADLVVARSKVQDFKAAVSKRLKEVTDRMVELPDEDTIKNSVKEARAIEQQVRDRKLFQELVDQTNAELKSLLDRPFVEPPVPSTHESLTAELKKLDELVASMAVVNKNAGLYESLWNTMKHTGAITNCPVCGHAITDKDRLHKLYIESKQQKDVLLAKMNTQSKLVGELQAEINNHNRSVFQQRTAYATKLEAARAAWDEANSKLAALPPIFFSLGDVISVVNQCDDLSAQFAELQASKSTCNAELSIFNEQDATIQQSMSVVEQKLGTETADVNVYLQGIVTADTLISGLESARHSLAKKQGEMLELEKEIHKLEGIITEQQALLDSTQAAISILESKYKHSEATSKALRVLSNVKDWFNYPNGPRTITSGVMRDMVEDINYYLVKFAAAFSVQYVADDVSDGLMCIFSRNGEYNVVDPSTLSGGQRIQLALSLRFANYCMFAAKLGILSLDEPTVYLDDNSINKFTHLLNDLKTVAKQLNVQLLIATHERAVIPFLDTVVDLNNT